MKRIVSVSIGSSKRNHVAEVEILGQQFSIERIGTDGSIPKAVEVIRELDGLVEAFGMGGIDLYIWAGQKRYIFREAKQIAAAAQKTPIVDGSGLKNTLERKAIEYVNAMSPGTFREKNVLMTSAMDRFGMADALGQTGCRIMFGDLIFALGVPIPLYSLSALNRIARVIAPIIVQMPFRWVYPTGAKQDEQEATTKMDRFYSWADVVAGDFHMIRKYLPSDLKGKTIITNTVTQNDVDLLRSRGVSRLVTTTPNLQGRSFGTNVMEALVVALLDKPAGQISSSDYLDILEQVNFVPRVEDFGQSGA